MFKNTQKALLLLATLNLGACGFQFSKDKEQAAPPSLISSDIFSLYEVNEDVAMFMVRLKTDSLLASATYGKNGEINISDAAKAAVLKEQEDFINEAKKLSSDFRVIYSTKLVMNSLTIVAPPSLYETINKMPMVQNAKEVETIEAPTKLEREKLEESVKRTLKDLSERNSVNFIGADKIQRELGLTGKGIKIGIIDSGIDYTHAMFGGAGTKEAYETINEDGEAIGFPNKKVVGGIDLVGSKFTPGSPYKGLKIPMPDNNPLDSGGHGTHVAGTVAGVGTGDGSYSGVAPDAELYAIKVFGNGGTGDSIVIAALEYALDPNGDLDPSDKLDVVNLSLGGNFGKKTINYTEAVANVVKAGVAVVASAGNSGASPYVVGAPSTSEAAFSIGASIDNMDHNWKFEGAKVVRESGDEVVQSISASVTRKLEDGEEITGDVVYVGLAAEDFSQEVLEKIPGKIVLADRGVNAFSEKIERAKAAGALAVVVANNAAGAPIIMGGEVPAPIDIIASMVSQEAGNVMKADLDAGKAVRFTFSNTVKFERPELIDTITSFSSRGPRSEDGLIKPEIVAPGQQIISAAAGSGDTYVAMNGTSMSGPHMAGVMGIMKQRFPELSVLDRKNILMATAGIMKTDAGIRYPVALQGAGRVDMWKAANAKLLPSTGGLSLGMINVFGNKKIRTKMGLKNISKEAINLKIETDLVKGFALEEESKTISLDASKSSDLELSFAITDLKATRAELDGFVKFINVATGEIEASIPVLAIVHNVSNVAASDLTVEASHLDQFGASASFKLKNDSDKKSVVLPFNLLGQDERKADAGDLREIRSTSCDLKSVGYKLVKKADANGKEIQVLQFGIKLYQAVSNWQMCDVSVLIDQDGDGKAEQEIAGTNGGYIPGLANVLTPGYFSILLDMKKAQQIRSDYEIAHRSNGGVSDATQNYVPAVVDLGPYTPFPLSSVSVLEIPTANLAKTKSGDLRVKISIHHENYTAVESVDYLGNENSWHTISLDEKDQAFTDLPEAVELKAGEGKTVNLTKGAKSSKLVLYMPDNKEALSKNDPDKVEQILKVNFR